MIFDTIIYTILNGLAFNIVLPIWAFINAILEVGM